MMQNPFFAAGPVPSDYFVGRESEVRIAFDLISKRSHLAIYGSSGMGKSSVLEYLASPKVWHKQGRNPSQAFIVYLNCQGISPFTPSVFWREVLSRLKDNAEGDTALESDVKEVLQKEEVETGDFRQILRKIGRQNKFLLLLLDDYDAALHPHDGYTEIEMLRFLSEFRDLAVHRPECRPYISTIVTTFRPLRELGPQLAPSGSPWYNHYLFQPLKPFPDGEVASLFFRGESKYIIPISINLRPGIVAITGGHPALLQNAGYLLYDMVKDGKIPNVEAFTMEFQNRTEQFFRDTWRFSTEVEQILLMLIALSHLEGRLNNRQYALDNIDLIFSQRNRELIDLEERGVIQHTVEGGKTVYAYTSSMMEWWVIREIENSNEEELQKREKVLFKLMSREQAQQVTKVIQEVWNYRNAVQSVVTFIIPKLMGNPT